MVLRVATVGVLAVALLNWPNTEPLNDNDTPPPEPANGATDRAPAGLPAPEVAVVEINRALADHIEADYDLLVDGARWSPLVVRGRTVGFVLDRVRDDSLLRAFGFRDRDLLLWSDDRPYDFATDEVRFSVSRDGRVQTIVVRVIGV